jgi:hypothetical protein
MIADNGRDYKELPHLTQGDEAFRAQFLSWDLGNLSFADVEEYLKVKDHHPDPDGQLSSSTGRICPSTPTPSPRWRFPGAWPR